MLQLYLDQVKQLLSDPTSNLVGAAIGVSIVVLLLVIGILVLLFFALTPHGNARKTSPERKRPQPKAKPKRLSAEEIAKRQAAARRARTVRTVTIVVGVVGAWIALFAGTSVNSYCGNTCHSMVGPSDQWKESDHSNVSCVRCHEGPFTTSFFVAPVSRARSVAYAIFQKSGPGSQLPARRCLSCHSNITEGTIVSGRAIAMSHAEPIAAGSVCSDCHGAQGHITEALTVGMPTCLRCHDGKKASVECVVCHPKGIEASISQPNEPVGSPVHLPVKPTCGGCHSQRTCDQCHGLRMPHPANFAEAKQHARLAAFDGKNRICYRCHTPNECNCHPSFSAHGDTWKQDHKSYKWSDGSTYCTWCHKTKDFCYVCH